MLYSLVSSPVGKLLLAGSGRKLAKLSFLAQRRLEDEISPDWQLNDEQFAEVRAQLDEYFQGSRTRFDVSLDIADPSSSFSHAVWHELSKIPYGETRSYRDIAERIGRPKAFRAVGQANHRNPIAIVIPCHRVIGSDGSLTGFGGGLGTKEYLLGLEERVIRSERPYRTAA